jgi:fatty acid desaturase
MYEGENRRAGLRIAASRIDLRISSQLAEKTKYMLWTIAVILIVLWALGLFTHVAGGLIHLLLVIAIIVIVFNLIRGRRMG